MNNERQGGEYQVNDANVPADEIFSGGITVGEAIERLRTRLLNLSAINRLLNYRHPKGSCIQIAVEPNINLVFDRLYVEGKGVPFKYVPEPPPDTYEGKRPEARLYAPRIGISTSFEFAPNPAGPNGRRLQGIQTLLYPADLERQLRKIASEAKTAIEETGTNMLFLVFGFLEFYDSEDSERPMLAPLLSLPVVLEKSKKVDENTLTYQYTVQHNGDDLAENHTLREKLRRDFTLSLPEFGEEDNPETYFARIEQAVENKRRWKVRRQITLGFLSFGKMVIWADLDTVKNPSLIKHDLIKLVFSGVSGGDCSILHAEDYHIDELPEASQPLIYDADSSQHSAIIDVFSGKNLVINGPPGTGKSQTITNIIAVALSKGKKVLFVSEKLAALEVVRHRLNHAGLGHFCLELHSHKTQKKKFIEDIQVRIEARFLAPPQFQARLATLHRQKTELARYAELMGSRVGNALGLTVNEVFWAAERRRQGLGDLSAEVNAIGFPDASKWTHDDIESRRSRLAGLAELYEAIRGFDSGHPWWGFHPEPLAPSDEETIARTIAHALVHARKADAAAEEAVSFFGFNGQPDAAAAARVRAVLEKVHVFPAGADPTLLARMFDAETDPRGQRSSRLLSDVASGVTKARRLFESASRMLADGERTTQEDMEEARRTADARTFSPALLTTNIENALEMVTRFDSALENFMIKVRISGAPYGLAGKAALDSFLANCRKPLASRLMPFAIRSIAVRAADVLDTLKDFSGAFERIRSIATRRSLSFDSTPESLARLAAPGGFSGLSGGTPVDAAALANARRFAAFPLADKPVAEIVRLKSLLEAEVSACSDALARCRHATERLEIGFDSTEQAVAEASALVKVAASAPCDLLEYRRPTFGHARTSEIIGNIRTAIAADKDDRASFYPLFYLDALPPPAEIKSAVAALRRKEGIFAFFDGDWRKAKKLHAGLCKEKRKVSSKRRADELAGLASWIEARENFVSNYEFEEFFGCLFRGLETNHDKISRLYDWYLSSRATLAECPGLTDKIDITSISSARILELAAKAESIRKDAAKLAGAEAAVCDILGANIAGFREAKACGWDAALQCLASTAESLGVVAAFFTGRADANLSPKDALRLMEARAELDAIAPDLSLLIHGATALREAGGEELGCLADIAGGRWSEAIPAVTMQAALASEIAGQARAFAAEDLPLSVAQDFAKAKSEFDEAWSSIAANHAGNRCNEWSRLIEIAEDDAATAREIFELLSSCARSGVSASEIFTASDEEAEARSILEHFSASDEVRRMLGDLFEGAATDLDRLSQSHRWGDAVCALILPMEIRKLLLSIDARDALETAKRLFDAVDAGCRGARESLESLKSYGSFSWDEWQQQTRDATGKDMPSKIRLRLESAAVNPGIVLTWSKYLYFRQTCQGDLKEFVTALETGKIPSMRLASAFELAAYQSIGRAVYKAFPELSRFNGFAHEQTRSDYRALDAEIVSLTGKDFANKIAEHANIPAGQRGTAAGDYTEMHLLRREINKQSRHIPIRQLVKRAGKALQELKPCFMMGPLSVAQYLEQGALKFDLVVMDEASQLRPEEALGAIARGSQLVVVGDPKQLPPTDFFKRTHDADDEDEDEASAAISGMESILDICQQLFTPVRSLRWHYRSHHESLIAFSNHHFYKNLVVFPSPYAKNPGLGVKYRYVKNGVYQGKPHNINIPEAQRVVDAILEHMIKWPDESLGVVTLNQTQRELIEELLDKKLKTFDEGDDFMGRWEAEGWPFFVKNLENVQGDERDVIFISTTFGKAPGTDKVRQTFGPISRPYGWRRLNVLFTRSRRRIELFTSLAPEDIVVDEKTPLGTKALRDYLDFAKRGVLVTTDEGERDPDSDFEVSVANVVRGMGYEVKPQLGVAGFFIDMAVRNPDRPGEYLAAIECDGATYHSGFSVRDRDRIRQEILESLGWRGRIHRIWSTDWFYNPRREAERLRNFLEERRRISAAEEPGGWEDEWVEETVEDAEKDQIAEELAEALVSASDGTEDLFVEVGDRVTYCPVDDPNERHSVMIVDSESNVKMGIVNEQAPLARALLGLSQGELGELKVVGQRSRQLRVLEIKRQEERM